MWGWPNPWLEMSADLRRGPTPWPVIGASEQASISAGQASLRPAVSSLGLRVSTSTRVASESKKKRVLKASVWLICSSSRRPGCHRDPPLQRTASDGLHSSRTMRTAEDIREPVKPAIATTATPISKVRRQEGALIVATTNITARLIATGRTDTSSPGARRGSHGQQQHRHQPQPQQADLGEPIQHLFGAIRDAPGQHVGQNGTVSWKHGEHTLLRVLAQAR